MKTQDTIGVAVPRFRRLGMVCRFRPLHLGGAAMLDAACSHADEVLIGIGGCASPEHGIEAKRDLRHPFTPEETEEMLHAYLAPRHENYDLIRVVDFGHLPLYRDGQMWRSSIKRQFGDLDGFLATNPYSNQLLQGDYPLIDQVSLIPPERRVPVEGKQVRYAMALGFGWQGLVPSEIAQYITGRGLDVRFREEFGLQALAEGRAPRETILEERELVQGYVEGR